eukprot:gnl/Hemi2/20283_TR6727_c0_g2_i1.p1 gnl/Hemi2/20283_TR6727_c0_g2~~gnl/Hemi2/20283_TR6727_c0_g2_i1.p1  ORF type:complete len:128 (+),score=7.27 gnl/Hemi2/20283_TR6727_c0_g2_i1:194-577(+)
MQFQLKQQTVASVSNTVTVHKEKPCHSQNVWNCLSLSSLSLFLSLSLSLSLLSLSLSGCIPQENAPRQRGWVIRNFLSSFQTGRILHQFTRVFLNEDCVHVFPNVFCNAISTKTANCRLSVQHGHST